MSKMRQNNLTRLTICATFASLSFVILYMGTATGLLDMSAAVLCGVITAMLSEECGWKMASGAVTVCAVLSFVILHDKTVAVLYLLAGGLYPLVKPAADRKGRGTAILIKLTVAVVSILGYGAAVMLFIPSEATKWLFYAGLPLGVLCFALYDVLLTRFAILYRLRLRDMIMRSLKRK